MQHQNGVIRRTMTSDTPPKNVNVVVGVDDEADAISTTSTYSRTCVLGCQVNKLALCRFPVHDPKRLNNWLKFFDIDVERVDSLGGLANLRVCLKHFNQKQQMAKTRIKTTPTRLQKVALAATTKTTIQAPITTTTAAATTTTTAAAAAVAATNNNAAVQELKRQINADQQSNRTRSNSNASTIIVAAPKRTTSISSATSTLSQTSSDSQSDTDCTIATTTATTTTTMPSPSPPPESEPEPEPESTATATVASAAINGKRISQQTNNNNNNNSNNNIKSIALLNKLSSNGKRKVYMITEKSSELKSNESAKRKMYLIMEDQNNGDNNGDGDEDGAMASLHISNQSTTDNNNKRKKLTFYTDNMNSELCTQKFEQILPEILNRIQQQNGNAQQQQQQQQVSDDDGMPNIDSTLQEQQQQQQQQQQQPQEQQTKVPITLPPKKNRIKIERNAQEIVTRSCATSEGRNGGECGAANTPVIVANMNVHGVGAGNNNNNTADAVLTTINNRSNGKKSIQHTEKQINLSSDFLFLMKMLPKLESIPEPQKQQVKHCIESFIEQSAGDNHEPAEY